MKFVYSLTKEIADLNNTEHARMMGAILLKNFIINKTKVDILQFLTEMSNRMKDMKASGLLFQLRSEAISRVQSCLACFLQTDRSESK